MGLSFFQRRSVMTILLEVLPNTVILTLTSLIIAYIFGVLAGAWLAWKRGSWIEGVADPGRAGDPRRARVLARHGAAGAASFNARLVPLRRRRRARAWPTTATGSASSRLDYLHHLALPALTLALYLQGLPLLLMRSNMLEVMHEEFVTMARMKGLVGMAHRHRPRRAQRAAAGGDRLRARRRPVDGRQRRDRDGVQLARHRPHAGPAVASHDYPLAQGAFLLIALVLVTDELRRRPSLYGARPAGEPWPKGLTPSRPARTALAVAAGPAAHGGDAATAIRSPSRAC